MSVGSTQFAHKLSLLLGVTTQGGYCLRSGGQRSKVDVFQAARKADENRNGLL